MRSYWSDPYLWIHLAGLAAVPLFFEVAAIGFAVGDPILPVWLELFLVSAIGIAPVLWMQWQKPFYIFSLIGVALKPEQLTEGQCRLLTLFKSERNRILAAIVPVVLVLVLYQVYQISAVAAPVAPLPSAWRLLGLLLAAIAFLGCNLFTQVPVSVASVMLHSEGSFASTLPFPLPQIRQSFSLFGLPVNQIVPPLIQESVAQKPVFTSVSNSSPPPNGAGVPLETDGLVEKQEVSAPAPGDSEPSDAASVSEDGDIWDDL
jgi:hypothetical protein